MALRESEMSLHNDITWVRWLVRESCRLALKLNFFSSFLKIVFLQQRTTKMITPCRRVINIWKYPDGLTDLQSAGWGYRVTAGPRNSPRCHRSFPPPRWSRRKSKEFLARSIISLVRSGLNYEPRTYPWWEIIWIQREPGSPHSVWNWIKR